MQQTETFSPGWIEVDLRQYAQNLDAIFAVKPSHVNVAVVLKDNAYGHGAVELARVAQQKGAALLIVATVPEALELRDAGLTPDILVLGERHPIEVELCCKKDLRICAGSLHALELLDRRAAAVGSICRVHLKIDSGMSRYGFRWSEIAQLPATLPSLKNIQIEGVLSHFAMSDELDKSFANRQLERFSQAVESLRSNGLDPRYVHICNSGGLLDLPQAHFNLVRVGILGFGVYPSKVCRRIDGIAPIMAVKASIAATKELEPGDHVGYGMRFTATRRMKIATLGIGYGWGFPRVRNQGAVLIHGRRAPIIGGVSMDAISVDITNIPETKPWDEAVLVGRSGDQEITIHDIAELKNSVSYDAMTSWRARLPRIYLR